MPLRRPTPGVLALDEAASSCLSSPASTPLATPLPDGHHVAGSAGGCDAVSTPLYRAESIEERRRACQPRLPER